MPMHLHSKDFETVEHVLSGHAQRARHVHTAGEAGSPSMAQHAPVLTGAAELRLTRVWLVYCVSDVKERNFLINVANI